MRIRQGWSKCTDRLGPLFWPQPSYLCRLQVLGHKEGRKRTIYWQLTWQSVFVTTVGTCKPAPEHDIPTKCRVFSCPKYTLPYPGSCESLNLRQWTHLRQINIDFRDLSPRAERLTQGGKEQRILELRKIGQQTHQQHRHQRGRAATSYKMAAVPDRYKRRLTDFFRHYIRGWGDYWVANEAAFAQNFHNIPIPFYAHDWPGPRIYQIQEPPNGVPIRYPRGPRYQHVNANPHGTFGMVQRRLKAISRRLDRSGIHFVKILGWGGNGAAVLYLDERTGVGVHFVVKFSIFPDQSVGQRFIEQEERTLKVSAIMFLIWLWVLSLCHRGRIGLTRIDSLHASEIHGLDTHHAALQTPFLRWFAVD